MVITEKMIVIGLTVLLGAGCAVGIGEAKRTKKELEKIGTTLEDIRSKTPVQVSQELVERTVNTAVREKASRAVERAIEDVKEDIRRDAVRTIETRTSDVIRELADGCRNTVADTLRRKAEEVDISALRREVREDAKKAIADKFEGELNDILEEFNVNLRNVSKIYSSIATTMSGKDDNSKNVTFKVG